MTRGRTAQRGYGAAHQQLRQSWAPRVALGIVPCSRCGRLIKGGQLNDKRWRDSWHLDHDDHDRTRYRGPSHALCNTTAPRVNAGDPRPNPRRTWL